MAVSSTEEPGVYRRISKSARKVLSARRVATIRDPGMYADGGNLYLQVGPEGGKSWVFRYYSDGKQRYMGLGPAVDVSLAAARDRSAEFRSMLRDGLDPLEERRRRREESRAELTANAITFSRCAADFIDAKSPGWSSKHLAQWQSTLETYVDPLIGSTPIAVVDIDRVLQVLQPIWNTKTETANRVRGRMEAVLDWATARRYRSGDNPARWRGNLDHLLAAPSKVAPKKHLPALPYAELPGFIAELRGLKGVGARALEFAILTAGRTTEVIQAERGEFDIKARVWTVPASRMKSGREHRVPLSARAVELVREFEESGSEWVFPGHKAGTHLSNMAMLTLLKKRIGRPDLTVHGFRSTFRDWTAEQTAYPNEVAEMALAHTIGDKTEKAYRRGDLFTKRSKMMADWSRFIDQGGTSGTVATIRKSSSS